MSDLIEKCTVCQALIDQEDLFCANCGAEAPKRDESRQHRSETARHAFECSGCGASMSYDAAAGSLRCPFCASVDLVAQADHKALAPQRVAPFQLNRDEAVQIMRRWLGRGFWRPGDLSESAAVVTMTPVYVPYWVFEATTHTYWTADTSRTPSGARGDWYPLTGEHRGRYEGLLVGASGALTPGETAALCPFDLDRGVTPDQVDLENVTVEQFAVARKYARPLARAGLEAAEANTCDAQYVPDRSRNLKVNVRIEGLTSQPVLLPIWIMAYRYRDRVFRFVANGQSGKATGSAPVSMFKIAAALGIGLSLMLLALLIAVLAAR